MRFLSLQPFVPSGPDFQKAKAFFIALGFNLEWDQGAYAGFSNNGCQFILQHYENKEFADQFMLSVGVENAEDFRQHVLGLGLPEKYGIRIGQVTQEPYGKEVNIIDAAGVCWHFVE